MCMKFSVWSFCLLTTSLGCPSVQGAIVHKHRRRAATVAQYRRDEVICAFTGKYHLFECKRPIYSGYRNFTRIFKKAQLQFFLITLPYLSKLLFSSQKRCSMFVSVENNCHRFLFLDCWAAGDIIVLRSFAAFFEVSISCFHTFFI